MVGDNADLIKAAIVDWIHSPYWSLGLNGSSWFNSGQDRELVPGSTCPDRIDSGTVIKENSLALHIREMCLRHQTIEKNSLAKMESPALPLVDRYLSRPGGALTPAALTAIDEACMSANTTIAVITLTDGRRVRATAPTLLALIVVDALMSCVRYPVEHGITKIVGAFHHPSCLHNSHRRRKVLLEPGSLFVDAILLLPTSFGRQARRELTASPKAGVSVGLYPLVSTFIPEVSGYLVPIINAEFIMGQFRLSNDVVTTSRPRALMWRLSRKGGVIGVLRNIYATVLAQLRSSARGLNVNRSLDWLGIDRKKLLAALNRFLTQSSGYTWLKGRRLRDFTLIIVEAE